MELCRLPRRPHEVLGLKLAPTQALFFDATILRASVMQRREETVTMLNESSRNKDFGIGAVIGLLAAIREG